MLTSAAYLARAELGLGDVSNHFYVDQWSDQVALLRVEYARLEAEEVTNVHLERANEHLFAFQSSKVVVNKMCVAF